LREAEEEIGIASSAVQILGPLPDVHVQASNFMITPYVGTLPDRPVFIASPDEVAEIIEVPLRVLRSPDSLHEEVWALLGQSRRVQFYAHLHHQIWGATARIVQEF